MTHPPTIGWAVAANGRINIRTVTDNKRGAVVNWLVLVAGVQVDREMSDGQIERLWMQHHAHHLAAVVKVCVEAMP